MLLGVGVCAVSLARLHEQQTIEWSRAPGVIAIGLAGVGCALAAMSFAWSRYLRALSGPGLSFPQSLHQVAMMLVGKYVPIMIGGVLARVSDNAGRVGPGVVVLATLAEQLGAVLAALAIGAIAYALALIPSILPLLVATQLLGYRMIPIIVQRLMEWLSLLLRKRFRSIPASLPVLRPSDLRAAIALQFVQWLGLGVFVAATAVLVMPGVSSVTLLVICGAYATAVVVGIAVVVLPGGLGVREAAFVGLSASALAPQDALQLALALRIAMSGFDVFAFLVNLSIRVICAKRRLPRQ